MASIFKIYEHEVAGVRVKRTFLWLPKKLLLHCAEVKFWRWMCFAKIAQRKRVRTDPHGFSFHKWINVSWVDSENQVKEIFKSVHGFDITPSYKMKKIFLWLPKRICVDIHVSRDIYVRKIKTRWLIKAFIKHHYDFEKLKFEPESWANTL